MRTGIRRPFHDAAGEGVVPLPASGVIDGLEEAWLASAAGLAEGVELAGGLIGMPAASARFDSVAGVLVLFRELTGVSTSDLLHAIVDTKIGTSATISILRTIRLHR